jgi:hypothetical protein
LVDRLAIANDRMEASRSVRGPLSLQHASLHNSDFDHLPAVLVANEFTKSVVETLRAKSCEPPPIMSITLAKALVGHEDGGDREVLPVWMREVALKRDCFEFTAWSFTKDNRVETRIFMFAIQQPLHIHLCKATRCDVPMPSPLVSDWESEYRAWERCSFDIDWGSMCGVEELVAMHPKDVIVFFDLENTSGMNFVCRHSPMPLDIYMDGFPFPDAQRGEPRKPQSSKSSNDTNPLLQRMATRHKLTQHSKSAMVVNDSASDDGSDVEVDFEAEQLAWDALASARAALDGSVAPRFDDFKVIVRGGWAAAAVGVGADCYTGKAIGADIESWCRAMHVPMSGRFGILKFASDARAQVMARAWCHRMQYFYNVTSGDPLVPIPAAAIASYMAPTEYIAAQEELVGNSACLKRCLEINSLFR